MKKLLKSGICGSINSARMHYSLKTESHVATKSKKKKKKAKCERKTLGSFHHNPNRYIANGIIGETATSDISL